MLPAQVLRELEALCERVGLAVREEPFDRLAASLGSRGGGLCRVKGKSVVLIDSALPVVDRIVLLTKVLGRFDLETVDVSPDLREKIENAKPGGEPRRRAAVKPVPMGLRKARPRGRRTS